jgi:glutamate 5-kinase
MISPNPASNPASNPTSNLQTNPANPIAPTPLPAQTVVLKIGTSSLTQPDTGSLAIATIASLVETVCSLRRLGHRVVLVSSGAVGVGCARLGMTERPRNIVTKQAVAAVGQGRLMRIYDDLFTSLQQPIAQVLLTRGDLVRRASYVNACNTLAELLDLGIVPIINENDPIANDELKFGDNDTLSALVASAIGADWLLLLTDVDRLYSADPTRNPDAVPIDRVANHAELTQLEASIRTDSSSSGWGTGGMQTKLTAARIATDAGVTTVITSSKNPQNPIDILNGKAIGTRFDPEPTTDSARKRWLAYGLVAQGQIYLDEGAVKAIGQGGKSLLAAGIVRVEGDFQASEAVELCDRAGVAFARGMVNYTSVELAQIAGRQSGEIAAILGYHGPATIVHRDNLALLLDL